MITINIKRNDRNEIVSFMLNGHAGYAEKGSDIVCAAVSAIANMVLIGFDELKLTPKCDIADNGFLSCEIPQDLENENSIKLQFLLECMVKEFMDIKNSYGKYIKVIQESA